MNPQKPFDAISAQERQHAKRVYSRSMLKAWLYFGVPSSLLFMVATWFETDDNFKDRHLTLFARIVILIVFFKGSNWLNQKLLDTGLACARSEIRVTLRTAPLTENDHKYRYTFWIWLREYYFLFCLIFSVAFYFALNSGRLGLADWRRDPGYFVLSLFFCCILCGFFNYFTEFPILRRKTDLPRHEVLLETVPWARVASATEQMEWNFTDKLQSYTITFRDGKGKLLRQINFDRDSADPAEIRALLEARLGEQPQDIAAETRAPA